LQQVDAQSDLGVITIKNDLKASDQCVKSYAKTIVGLGYWDDRKEHSVQES